jgi:hypothetical protein
MLMPQLHNMQAQKYRLRLVALRSRRTLTSAQMNHAIPKKAVAVMDSGRACMPSVVDVPSNASSMPLAVKVSDIARVGQVLTDWELSAQDLLSFSVHALRARNRDRGLRRWMWKVATSTVGRYLSFAAIGRAAERRGVVKITGSQGNTVLGMESGDAI